jgi:TonB family protein
MGVFAMRSAESRSSPAATLQTGAFEQPRRGESPSTQILASNAGQTGFDGRAEKDKRAVADSAVRKTTFDEVKAAPANAGQAAPAAAVMRPVEILEKPKPAYTEEARSRRIEGDVLLDVIFAAAGEVRVLGVKRGLGYGLDENAIEAARRIRFHPATQAGMPVDQRVVLHVVFQITG